MQQLKNASDPLVCARAVLEAVFEVMLTVREQAARRHGYGHSLVHIRAMGVLRNRPRANLSMLADQLALTLSATSRLVDCLVKKGLVARTVPAGDRRTLCLTLTRAGARTLEAAMRKTQAEIAVSLERLTAAQRMALSQSADSLRQVIEEEAGSRK